MVFAHGHFARRVLRQIRQIHLKQRVGMSQKKGWHFLQILPHFAGVKSNEVLCTGSYYFQIYFSSICWKAILSLPD